MPVNTLTPPLRKGDLLIVRYGDQHQAKLALVWDVPYIRRRATPSNVRILQTSNIIDHDPQTDVGRQIQAASNAEEAVAAFRRAIDRKLWDPLNKFWYDRRARQLESVLNCDDKFFLKPSAEVVRKVLRGDVCPNPHCQGGFVAARHRAAVYHNHQLPSSTVNEDRKDLAMQCPACISKAVVIENEKQLLVTLRVDSGGQMTTSELIEMREHEKQLNERRLEAGHSEIAFSPDVVLVVYGIGASGWMTRHPGRWLEQMRQFSTDSVVYPPDFLKRKFGNIKQSVLEGQCGICLGDEFGEEEEVVVLPCLHLFHEYCMIAWWHERPSCSVCRRPVAS